MIVRALPFLKSVFILLKRTSRLKLKVDSKHHKTKVQTLQMGTVDIQKMKTAKHYDKEKALKFANRKRCSISISRLSFDFAEIFEDTYAMKK